MQVRDNPDIMDQLKKRGIIDTPDGLRLRGRPILYDPKEYCFKQEPQNQVPQNLVRAYYTTTDHLDNMKLKMFMMFELHYKEQIKAIEGLESKKKEVMQQKPPEVNSNYKTKDDNWKKHFELNKLKFAYLLEEQKNGCQLSIDEILNTVSRFETTIEGIKASAELTDKSQLDQWVFGAILDYHCLFCPKVLAKDEFKDLVYSDRHVDWFKTLSDLTDKK